MNLVLISLLAVLLCTQTSICQGWNWVHRTDDIRGIPNIREFTVVDSTYCYATGTKLANASLFILRSRNKGINWDTLFIDHNLLDISYWNPICVIPDTNHIYISAANNSIIRTLNAGISWQTIVVDSTRNNKDMQFFKGMNYDNIGNGVLIRDSMIYKTSDFGLTWTKKSIPQPDSFAPYLIHIKFFGLDTIYAWSAGNFTNTYRFCHSYDGGSTWHTFKDCPQNFGIASMTFIDKLKGWTVYTKQYADSHDTGYDIIYHTSNGGKSWEPQLFAILFDLKTNTEPFGLSKISFVDSLNGIAAHKFKILRSTDGGKYWKIEDRNMGNASPFLGAIEWVNSKIALLGNNSGSILRWNKDDITQVEEQDSFVTEVYPNPASTIITVKSTTELYYENVVSIFDVNGKSVRNEIIKSGKSVIINLSGLSTGTYFILVNTGKKFETIPLTISR